VPDPPADLEGATASTLYLGCAIVDHSTRSLAPEMALVVTDGRVGWLGPADEAPDPGPGGELVDAGGTTAVAGMVDAHSHLTLPGGSHWIDRAGDPTDRLLATARHSSTAPSNRSRLVSDSTSRTTGPWVPSARGPPSS
jgi:predicted amidohydrolase YtcJ